MRNLKKSIILSTILLSTTNCAMTYKAPIGTDVNAKSSYNQSYSQILKKAKRTLALQGYQINYYDKEEGIITTLHKNYKINPSHANCGKTMGLDYLKDKRTKTEVSFNIIVDKNQIIIKSNIKAEYKPSNFTGDQNITLTCISKGVLEKELLKEIS